MPDPVPIPGPKAYPLIGNLLDIQDEVPLHAIERLIDIYGPIVKITVLGNERTMVGGFDLFDELCDEKRFYKLPPKALQGGDPKAAKGLFTAASEYDEDWGQAHRILMPAFGPIAIQGMFEEMHDIASQLVLKWARKGEEYKIPVTDDFTRLTLDTIALCAMDYRFNSFYQDELHPFVQAMTNVLKSRSNASQLSGMLHKLSSTYAANLARDAQYQKETSEQLVKFRREHPTEKKDLLNAMMYVKDPKTGTNMRDGLIAANMQTFLIAGHETTSGLLSFAFLNLLKNPSTYFAAQQEVDRVIGRNKLEVHHLSQLKYLNSVLRETLRLTPTAPAYVRGIRPENKEENPTIGGKYSIRRDTGVLCLIGKIQRDPKIWGEDAAEFNPDRMSDENFDKLPQNAWKPFGTGVRACIGRAFAWQEALLASAMLLQNFDLRLDNPNYEMSEVQTLTIKPKDFFMRATLRAGITATKLQDQLFSPLKSEFPADSKSKDQIPAKSCAKMPIQILYGSNTGTCQSLAQKLSAQSTQLGYSPTIMELDSGLGKLQKGTPNIIITCSYEGQPADNAARFVAWLECNKDKTCLEGVKFAVFGCGHRDWRATFQRIPTLIDDKMAEFGAVSLTERGVSDAANGGMVGDFDTWFEKQLLPSLAADQPKQVNGNLPNAKPAALPSLKLELSTQSRAAHLQQHVSWANVVATKCLTAPGEPEKRHIEIQLPSGMSYSVGDYLAVLPINPEEAVRRVIKQFGLPWDAVVTITDAGATILPVGVTISVSELLRGYVELSQPASRKDVALLTELTQNPAEKESLQDLSEAYTTDTASHRPSILDLLSKNSSITLPFADFLPLLSPLKLRHYSISSSPLQDPTTCTLTYSVINTPTLTGPPGTHFHGVTGTYLKTLSPGDAILIAIRSTNKLFRPPADPALTPIVMLSAGSGLAPFRGFVQERAIQMREGGRKLAPALLFIGCRSPTLDQLYGEELAAWEALGAVDVRYAYSREPGRSRGCRYVQDRMVHDKVEIFDMWDAGARIYICGSREVAREIKRAARRLVAQRAAAKGMGWGDEEVEGWFAERRNERVVTDIFS